MKKMSENESCPICDRDMEEPRLALSRFDNVTNVCPLCGVAEALAPLVGEVSEALNAAQDAGDWSAWKAIIVKWGVVCD